MLRRTFLFLIGIALARVLADYFSVVQNRDNFLTITSQLWQKLLAFLSNIQSDETPQPLPSNPIIKSPDNSQLNDTISRVVQPSQSLIIKRSANQAKPVQVSSQTVAGVSFYITTIDLTDPEHYITIGLANNAILANNSQVTAGDEHFENMVARYQAAVVASGTFFDQDDRKSVLGNMVAAGKFLKYSRWENYGTTLGIKAGNQLEMVTARTEGKPDWSQHWFSLTCGPRLLKGGKVWLSPLSEGFKDPSVLGVGSRTAIGFPASKDKLFLVTFLDSLSLEAEAKVMLAIGCLEAMNLDGGDSVGLAHQGQILLPPGRNLTNVLVVYDRQYPAPAALKQSWERFQKGSRPTVDRTVFFD